ncbi:oxidoreductase [Streptomyces xylophagus]|uniref:oxidoreductase n=1 Tax=Streptomyces xylophagus TaxID=285514 RepID=UPI00068D7539|nr:hypothetical protein [Streptomyces xylophagus]
MPTPPTCPLLRPLRIGTLTVPGRLLKSAKAGLRDWVDLAHSGGSLLIAQLNHGGRQMVRSADPGKAPVSASAVREPVYGTKPRPLRRDEIPEVVETFASAAERAQNVGFDGVQIHAAHGYLLSQFLTPHTNRRTDEYGGSLDNRMRLLREVIRAIRTRVGDDFPVLLKLNGTDMLPLRRGAMTAELVHLARVPGRPVCEYRNGCIARFGGKPIDCYVEPIRIRKNHMLRRTEQA